MKSSQWPPRLRSEADVRHADSGGAIDADCASAKESGGTNEPK